MDIKAKAEGLVKTLKEDKTLLSRFQSDPVSVVEEKIGVDLPNDKVNAIVDMVKAKLSLDKLGGKMGGLGKLFK